MNKLILLLFILTSCAQVEYEEKDKKSSGMIVDLKTKKQRVMPRIREEKLQSSYGPVDVHESEAGSDLKRRKINAYVLGPGGYRCLGHLSALKKSEEIQNTMFKPSVILGHGLCSVVAAYYSFGFKSEYIEWKFFGFLRKVKGVKLFSKAWLKIYENVLINDLKNKRIEDSKLTLMIPTLEDGRIRYLSRGDLKSALISNVSFLIESKYKPTYTKSLFKRHIFENIGVSRVYIFDVLSDHVELNQENELILSHFEKAKELLQKKINDLDVKVTLPLGRYKIDDPSMVTNLMFDSDKYIKETMQKFIKE